MFQYMNNYINLMPAPLFNIFIRGQIENDLNKYQWSILKYFINK